MASSSEPFLASGEGEGDLPTDLTVSEMLASAHVRTQRIDERLVQVTAMQDGLTSNIRLPDQNHESLPVAHACRGLPQLRRIPLKATRPLGRLLGSRPARAGVRATQIARLPALAWRWWDLWQRKHEALTEAERLYAAILTDARRTNVLLAELVEVEALSSKEEASSPRGASQRREAAVSRCQAALEGRAMEAVEAYRERAKAYPCGSVSPNTGRLRLARTPEEVEEIVGAFKAVVAQETRLTVRQMDEILLAREPKNLVASISRRLDFWDRQIEENWTLWSEHSTIFHDACADSSESWVELSGMVEELLAWAEAGFGNAQRQTPPILYLMPFLDLEAVHMRQQLEALHDALVEVALVVVLLVAWSDHHNLEGDGQVFQQARELFHMILAVFSVYFDGRPGATAVQARLLLDPIWRMLPTSEDRWWSPCCWRSAPS